THAVPRPVDVALAVRQHEAYVAALRSAGWRGRAAAPADDQPDAVFVEDALVACGDVAVVARSGHPRRRGGLPGAGGAALGFGLRLEQLKQAGARVRRGVLADGDAV